jgi:hypothetical protein
LLLAPPPFSGACSVIPPLLLCASIEFAVYCSVLLFLGGRQSAQEAGLSWEWLGEFHVMHGAHLFGLPNVSQAGLEPAAVATAAAAHKFSQYNMAWGSFPRARDSGCWSFISAKCGSSVSARCWSHRAHIVCFCTLVTILEKKLVHIYA